MLWRLVKKADLLDYTVKKKKEEIDRVLGGIVNPHEWGGKIFTRKDFNNPEDIFQCRTGLRSIRGLVETYRATADQGRKP